MFTHMTIQLLARMNADNETYGKVDICMESDSERKKSLSRRVGKHKIKNPKMISAKLPAAELNAEPGPYDSRRKPSPQEPAV